MFFIALLMYFGCYGNFKFPLTCNGKNENRHFCYLIADILERENSEMLIERSKPAQFHWLSWTK